MKTMKDTADMIGCFIEKPKKTLDRVHAVADEVAQASREIDMLVGTMDFLALSFADKEKTQNDLLTESFKFTEKHIFTIVKKLNERLELIKKERP